jgi:hypothetical protein
MYISVENLKWLDPILGEKYENLWNLFVICYNCLIFKILKKKKKKKKNDNKKPYNWGILILIISNFT